MFIYTKGKIIARVCMAAEQKLSNGIILKGLHKAIEEAFVPASLVADKINENLPEDQKVDARYVKDRLLELEEAGVVKVIRSNKYLIFRFEE
ncbi:MAG: hypothetical protein ABFD07_01520 [Methanobacterium sp.]